MDVPIACEMSRRHRSPPTLPFGWGAVTVLLVGAGLLIGGIVMILYGMIGFLMGTIGAATSDSFSISGFFQSFFGAIMLFVIGGVLAGIGGWLVRLWWIFLLVGAVTGAGDVGNTAPQRAARTPAGPVRCPHRGRPHPPFSQLSLACPHPPRPP